MDIHILYIAVRTREIDILHRAHRMTLIFRIFSRTQTVMVDGHDFTRFDITHIFRTYSTERAGLTANHITVPDPTNGKRPQAIFVPAGVNPVLRHNQESESALNHIQGLHNRENSRTLALQRIFLDKVSQYLAVRSGLEQTAPVLEVLTQLERVHDIAVMGQCEVSGVVSEQERLDVFDSAPTCSGITDMTYRHISLQCGEIVVVEHLSNESQTLHTAKLTLCIDRNYSATFLTAVLKRMQSVVCDFGRPRYAPYAEHATFLVKSAERLPDSGTAHYLFLDCHSSF